MNTEAIHLSICTELYPPNSSKMVGVQHPLVNYPSSDEENPSASSSSASSPAKEESSLKRKRDAPSDLPALPSRFHDLYASASRVSTRDIPSLHQGRKRVIPHVDGNWPTHIYIEWYPSKTEDVPLTRLISLLQETVPVQPGSKVYSLVTSEIGVPLPLHVSLSRSLGFVASQKDEFVDSLSRAIRVSGVRPFDISFDGLEWVANFEGTRWFLVLRIPQPSDDGLNKLLFVCNSTVKQFGQPPLYPKPPIVPSLTAFQREEHRHPVKNKRSGPCSTQLKPDWSHMQDATAAFHISLAWTLEQPSQELLELTKTITGNRLDDIKQIQVQIKEIKCKVGNNVTSMSLPRNILED
ncbi:hypothetical protein QTJ16_004876 [Diplocarpon rosae]|uniref:U6 snRNA phosphodiesterase n=1 Tax=Diplocarpon rosae TaxID=946125 RepID=A0AAD9WE28_9HELO|nr:hypothetical protein QTJ16_004876 [Diplocarpon rosae]